MRLAYGIKRPLRLVTGRTEWRDQLESVYLLSHDEIVGAGYARSSSRNTPRPSIRVALD
jgi:hypothetical protein